MRGAAHVVMVLALWGVAGGALAQELSVSGRVVDGAGDPATGVEIRLLPVPSPFEQGLQDLAGNTLPEAIAATKTDDAGRFTVNVPEAGFWRLIADASGSQPAEFDFGRAPLLDSTLLPTLELKPATSVVVAVVDDGGEAAPGAWVESWLAEPPARRLRQLTWQPLLSPARTSTTGDATLRLPVDNSVKLRAWRAQHRASDEKILGGSSVRLRLARGRARHLVVRDAQGQPVVGAVVRVGEVEWPAGRTDVEGSAVIHDREGLLVLADGRVAAVTMAEDEGTPGKPFEVVVPAGVLV